MGEIEFVRRRTKSVKTVVLSLSTTERLPPEHLGIFRQKIANSVEMSNSMIDFLGTFAGGFPKSRSFLEVISYEIRCCIQTD